MISKIKVVACALASLYLPVKLGAFGVNSVSYYDDVFIKHKAIRVNDAIFFTLVTTTWIDSKIYDKFGVYKETKLYFRPIQIHLNHKHIYSSFMMTNIFYRTSDK